MLFDRYYRPLVLYAGSLIDDDTMAEDLVQEFFVRLWEDDYLKHIEEKALSSYLFSSIRNSCYTYTHKKDVLRMAVIGRMPEQTRKVVDCVLMRDMKYQDAADELQVSLNTVKTLLRNGMRILREELKRDEELILLLIMSRSLGD